MIFPVVRIGALADLPPEAGPAWREWLSVAEVDYCVGFQRATEHLAARMLAKWAVAGVLGWRDQIPWLDISIVRDPAGPPSVRLSGDAECWRQERHVVVPGVSLTHAGGYAAALAWLPADRAKLAEDGVGAGDGPS